MQSYEPRAKAQPGNPSAPAAAEPKASPRERLRGMPLDAQEGALAPAAEAPGDGQRDAKSDAKGAGDGARDFVGGGIGALPKTRGEALARHAKEQALVANVIQKGLSMPEPKKAGVLDPNILLRNAAQWIQAGEAKVTVLSPTDEQDQRARHLKSGYATFDTSVQWPGTGGSYAQGSDANVEVVKDGARGGMQDDGVRLTLIGPQDAAEVEAVLRHEVQHDADQSFKGDANAEPVPAAALKQYEGKGPDDAKIAAALPSVWNAYQSEFRAFWIMNAPGDPALQFGSAKEPADNFDKVYGRDTHFKNQRQERIFNYLVQNGYDHVRTYYATNAAFRDMVDNFTLPASANLVDSIRVHHLSQAIGRCTPSSAADSPEVAEVLEAAGALDKFDRGFLRAKDYATPFWKRARAMLPPTALAKLEQRIGA